MIGFTNSNVVTRAFSWIHRTSKTMREGPEDYTRDFQEIA
jgi:hypothetical protein